VDTTSLHNILSNYFPLFFRARNTTKHHENTQPSLSNSDQRICVDRPVFCKKVLFGVKRDRIQNRTKTWKQGTKRVVDPPKTQYSAEILRNGIRTSSGARQLVKLAAARPSGPIKWARGNCALKRSVAARPVGVFPENLCWCERVRMCAV